jgi:hypothetical protein
VLVLARVLPSGVRSPRAAREDRPARLLALAARGLPPGRQEWGRAMEAELHEVRAARARRRFALGCAWGSALIRARALLGSREPGGVGLRVVVLGASAAAVALAGWGLVRYPDLRSDRNAWASMAGLLALAFAYGALTLMLSRGTTIGAVADRRRGLAAGLVSGGAWFLVLSPPAVLKPWVLLPLVVALLAPACAARSGRSASRAALWSGIVGGLVAAIAWVAAAYVRDGRPYDAGLLHDFHRSGAVDLAAYAVRGDLATALELLVLVPFFALAFGSLAGLRARRAPVDAA